MILYTIIDHFSKFLTSYPNAKNALFCIKDFYNFIGIQKIIQSDKISEYKNNIIMEYCEANTIKKYLVHLDTLKQTI